MEVSPARVGKSRTRIPGVPLVSCLTSISLHDGEYKFIMYFMFCWDFDILRIMVLLKTNIIKTNFKINTVFIFERPLGAHTTRYTKKLL